jgi:hypothetical protein
MASLYTLLAKSDIRLLEIKSVDPIISCDLKIHRREDVGGSYSALSYSWGPKPPKQPTRDIMVNDIRFVVRETLHEALRQLYQRLLTENEKAIWTDAICLNQEDKEEQGIHIELMGDIYGNARQVLAFLGAATPSCNREIGSDAAMDCIDSIVTELNDIRESENLDRFETMDLPPENDGVWQAISLLLHRSWFNRLWIWQEAVLAKRLYFGCGTKWITFERLNDFIRLLQIKALVSRVAARDPARQKNEGIFFVWPTLVNHRQTHLTKGKLGMPVPALLQFYRSRECEWPIDRIWGTRALWDTELVKLSDEAEWRDKNPTGQEKYCETYIKMAKFYITYDPTLLFLSLAASVNKNPDLPSWCPDWNTKMAYDNFGTVGWFNAGFDQMDKSSRKPNSTVQDDSSVIQIRGVRVDTVKKVIDGSYVDPLIAEEKLTAYQQLFAWEEKCLEESRSLVADGEHVAEGGVPPQHWRTLIADGLDNMTVHNTNDLSADYLRWKAYIRGQCSGHSVLPPQGAELNSAERYLQATRRACPGRRFFSTAAGCTGLGPPEIAVGDVVCAFNSGASLWILRWNKTRAEAELLGDAYVCDLMTMQDIASRVPAATPETFSVL